MIEKNKFRLYPDDIAEKIRLLPQLFDKMLCGKATAVEMTALANLYSEHGIAALQLSEELISLVPKIDISQMGIPGNTYWKRYGSQNKPVFSSPLAGQLGTQGAVLIAAPEGDTCDISQFDEYITPLHYHPGVVHITAVTQGEGIFLIAGEKEQRKYLVKVPVQRGDMVLIPADVIHTFYTNKNTFQVVSFTTRLIPTDSPEFLVLASADELKTRPFIDYTDFFA